ncbi:hypothetical protein CPB86DRAFT_702211 [Serendipita vermifera]|nr:hypothetical protein CPB86DRAFT_702211 [Serendipita vermifera]
MLKLHVLLYFKLLTKKCRNLSAQADPNAPRLFALLIGINEYASPNVRNLYGAVSDAKAIQEYLEVTLGVPTEQISCLHNSQATRAAIIQKLTELQMDPRIQRGDPILVYYAGHGGETDAPIGWETNDPMVQMLIPYDFSAEIDVVNTKISGGGNVVYAIPDRTIGTLLERVAFEKGDNLTVIFDCCHSGSGTRGFGTGPDSQDRTLGITTTFPADIDMDILSSSRTLVSAIPAGFLHSNLQSHVLLAACNSNELAREVRGRGVFTQALLKALRESGIENLSYSDLIDGLPSLLQ